MASVPSNAKHEALLRKVDAGIRAFLSMLHGVDGEVEDVAMFALDLRCLAGAAAAAHLLGAAWVQRHLREDQLPVVLFPLSGTDDVAAMVDLVAPALKPFLGRKPSGAIQVMVVDDEGIPAMFWPRLDDLIDRSE